MTDLMTYRFSATNCLLLALGILGTAFPLAAARHAPPAPGDGPALGEVLHWLSAPPRFDAEYDYELTVEIRLLLFWTEKDDVGGEQSTMLRI